MASYFYRIFCVHYQKETSLSYFCWEIVEVPLHGIYDARADGARLLRIVTAHNPKQRRARPTASNGQTRWSVDHFTLGVSFEKLQFGMVCGVCQFALFKHIVHTWHRLRNGPQFFPTTRWQKNYSNSNWSSADKSIKMQMNNVTCGLLEMSISSWTKLFWLCDSPPPKSFL